MKQSSLSVTLRSATLADIPALVALETASFETDRLATRHFRRLLGGNTCELQVAEIAGAETATKPLAGYVLILFRRTSRTARIYSIAVDARKQGMGIGARLLAAGERAATERGCSRMVLEVRPENAAAIALYERHGYRCFGRYACFYEDGSEALRLEKILKPA